MSAEQKQPEKIHVVDLDTADQAIAANKESYKPKSWSLSALNLYEQCPRKYALLRFEKIKVPESPALTFGIHCHNVAEQYLLGNITGMPREIKVFEKEFRALKKHGAEAEKPLVLDKDWQAVNGNKAWFSKKAWFRGKVDAVHENLVIDFKTGKKYPDHEDQARLYANAVMCHDDSINEIDVEFWYLKNGEVSSYSYSRESLDSDIDHWNERVGALFSEKEWPPIENSYCKWCEVAELCPIGQKKSSSNSSSTKLR